MSRGKEDGVQNSAGVRSLESIGWVEKAAQPGPAELGDR